MIEGQTRWYGTWHSFCPLRGQMKGACVAACEAVSPASELKAAGVAMACRPAAVPVRYVSEDSKAD